MAQPILRCLMAATTLFALTGNASMAQDGQLASSSASAPKPAAASAVTVGASAPRSPSGADKQAVVGKSTSDSAAQAISAFGLRLLANAAPSKRAETNQLISPYGIANALGLLYFGSHGQTADEVDGLFKPSPTTVAHFFLNGLPALNASLPAPEISPLLMANRIWLSSAIAKSVPPAYGNVVKFKLNASAEQADFSKPEDARHAINAWTSEQTKESIKELLSAGSLSQQTKMVLTNAVHFKSAWAKPFDTSLTASLPFFAGNGKSLMVPTMVGEETVWKGRVHGHEAMAIPMDSPDYQLLIVQSNKSTSTNALIHEMEHVGLIWHEFGWTKTSCELHLPKFHLRASAGSEKKALEALGMKQAFTDHADLTPMLGNKATRVAVDDVIHAATMTVDESGIEAAAATAVLVAAKSFSIGHPALCVVDHPFVFGIVHTKTSLPLFLGVLNDPGQ